MVAPATGVVLRVAPLANVTATLVAPLQVPKAEVGLMVMVKPDAVGAGDAASVPIKACSRSFTLLARMAGALVLESPSMRWPLPMWVASNAGAVMFSLSARTL